MYKKRKKISIALGISVLGCSMMISDFKYQPVNESRVYAEEYASAVSMAEDEIPIVTTQAGIVSGGSVIMENENDIFFSENECKVYLFQEKRLEPVLKESIKGRYTWVYISDNTDVADVSSKGVLKGKSVGSATITVYAKEKRKLRTSIKIKVVKEKKGWHKTEQGKRYYVKKDGTRKTGYFKVGQDYYFAKANGYIVTAKWKYVEISGRKYKLYFAKNGKQKQNVTSLIGEQDSYKIEVNTLKNMIVILAKDESGQYRIPVKAMVCSCGVPGRRTIQGTYKYLSQAGVWHTLKYGTYGKYCTRFKGPYLFHSVVYSKYGDDYSLYREEYEKLGQAASHGCVRLQVKDAKWIYTRYKKCIVELYESSNRMPLVKPTAKPITSADKERVCDPTDNDIK